jgi:hypothetical protein
MNVEVHKMTPHVLFYFILFPPIVLGGPWGEADKRVKTFPQITLPVVFHHFSNDVDLLDIDAQGSDVGGYFYDIFTLFVTFNCFS